jgi:hypothetical protein
MIRWFICGLLFSCLLQAKEKSVLCQPDSFGLRKNYEIWLLQHKIVIDDQLEEIPLSVLDLLYSISQVLPPQSTKRIAPMENAEKSGSIKLNDKLFDPQLNNIYQHSLIEYCQGRSLSRLNAIWYFPANEIIALFNNLYKKQEIVDFIENKSNLDLNAPASFSFKRFESNFSDTELFDILYLIIKYRDFNLFKIKFLSRLQPGLELKDKNVCEYVHGDKILRFSDAYFKKMVPSCLFQEMAQAHFFQMDKNLRDKYQSLSFDNQLKAKKDASFLHEQAQASVESDFIVHFEAFFTIPDALYKTTPIKFQFLQEQVFNNKVHPDLLLEKYLLDLKMKKNKQEASFFELRSENKGDFERVDFIFNHSMHDIKNQLLDHLHVKIECGKELVLQADNQNLVINSSRARVSQILPLTKANEWKSCKKFKVQIMQSGRERFSNEFIKN